MGRLIDADAYRDDSMQDVYEVLSDESDNIKANLIIDAFDRIPTAYDVDAVVKQLEELTEEECTLHECGIRSERCKPCIAKKAIEIVKGGGVNGN